MGVFSTLQTYAQPWEETEREAFTKEEIKEIKSAKVVKSEYGLSACFMLKSGGQRYIPLSREVQAEEGESIDVKNAEIVTLSRMGDDDIYRLEY